MSVSDLRRGAFVAVVLLLFIATLPGCRTLTAGNGIINGTMTYRDGSPAPAGSTAVLELVRLDAGAAPSLITRTSFTPPATSTFPFVLNYDPTMINPEIPHALRATISTAAGTAIYTTPADYVVTFDGDPVGLDLVAATGATTAPPGSGTVSGPRR